MTSPAQGRLPALHTFRVDPVAGLNRAHALLYALALLALFHRHALSLLSSPSLLSFSLLVADLVLAFMWATAQACRWRPAQRRVFPDRLVEAVGREGLPDLDVFVCTADPHKEPPVSVVSTALSAMAFDYPAEKLSVYLSDDGGSEVTLFAFMEAARFARHWLPFCRENRLQDRSPEAYFGSSHEGDNSQKMKMMYQAMKEKVESVLERGQVGDDVEISPKEREVFRKWKEFTRRDHPSIIKVLLESRKDTDSSGNALPNLIYISREKRATFPHHFKAGALNVLTRVSSIMTNAPILLTLDCDTYSNDPKAPLRALCYLLDPAMASKLGFVQFPQRFQGVNKNDTYASEIKRLFRIHARGMDGLRGPGYVGSNCFFVRRSLSDTPSSPQTANGSLCSEPVLERAHEAASCAYELGTKWGSSTGFRYGSLVEDYNTGYRLHCEGWNSVFCDPERPAFLGDVPKSLNDALSQCKRWIVGLYEVGLSSYSPLTYGTSRISFLMGLSYAHVAFWGSWCIPVMTYGLLPPLALIYGMPLFPKVSDPWFYLYSYLFLAAYGQDLAEFLADDGTIQSWWSEQRMWMIRGITSCLFGTCQFALKQVGFSAIGFNVTSKVQEDKQSERYKRGLFDFGIASPFFVSMGTAAMVNLSSFAVGVARAARVEGGFDEMFVQLFLSGFVVANCWPIYEAMFLRKDGGRIPRDVTLISAVLAGLLISIACFLFTV